MGARASDRTVRNDLILLATHTVDLASVHIDYMWLYLDENGYTTLLNLVCSPVVASRMLLERFDF